MRGFTDVVGNELTKDGRVYNMFIPNDKIRFTACGFKVLARDLLTKATRLVYRIEILINGMGEYAVYSCAIDMSKSNIAEECMSKPTLKLCSDLKACKVDINSKTYSRKKSGYISLIKKPSKTTDVKPNTVVESKDKCSSLVSINDYMVDLGCGYILDTPNELKINDFYKQGIKIENRCLLVDIKKGEEVFLDTNMVSIEMHSNGSDKCVIYTRLFNLKGDSKVKIDLVFNSSAGDTFIGCIKNYIKSGYGLATGEKYNIICSNEDAVSKMYKNKVVYVFPIKNKLSARATKSIAQVLDTGIGIMKRASLNYFDPKENKNKFYIIELQDLKDGNYCVCGTYGRVGANGQKFTKDFSNLMTAEKEYSSKLRSKKNKGYVEVTLATHSKGSSANKTTVDANYVDNVKVVSTLEPEVTRLVSRLYEEANKAISVSLSGEVGSSNSDPLGNLSKESIETGRRILNDLGRAINNNDDDSIEYYSTQYYKFIPRQMPSNLRVDRSWLLNTQDKLSRELDVLNLYEDSLRMLPAMLNNNVDSKYNALNCDISYVTDAKVLDYIRDKVEKSVASNHNYKLRVKNVYTVNLKNEPEFDSSCGNVKHLFHGSRSCNLVGILSSHLKMPNSLPNVQKTGAMFGPGIYFANNSSKSYNYSSGSWGNTRNKYTTAYLFVTEVALGNVKKVDDATYFRQAPSGYDSVMGCKGRNLYNDEFIVYRENQVRIKYLVEVERY